METGQKQILIFVCTYFYSVYLILPPACKNMCICCHKNDFTNKRSSTQHLVGIHNFVSNMNLYHCHYKYIVLISKENSEKMYEDVYKTKSNHPKIEQVSLFLDFIPKGISCQSGKTEVQEMTSITTHSIFREDFHREWR